MGYPEWPDLGHMCALKGPDLDHVYTHKDTVIGSWSRTTIKKWRRGRFQKGCPEWEAVNKTQDEKDFATLEMEERFF